MSTKSRIAGLIALIVSSTGCAVLLAVFFLYQFGPSSSYKTNNTLIQPDLIQVLSFNELNPKTGGESRFQFKQMLYFFYDSAEQRWQQIVIDSQQYRGFYELVKGEGSIPDVAPDVESLFDTGNPGSLKLFVETVSNAPWQKETKLFQEIQFANEGNFYRIQLRDEPASPMGQWAYYYHPNIKNEVENLFNFK